MDGGLLHDQCCLITGGSRGLGLAMGLACARAGARVAFTYSQHDRDAVQARRQIEAITQATVPTFKGSVADAQHAQTTVRDVIELWGRLDILINNAAVHQILPIALLEEEDWDHLMDVNLKGVYLFSRAALRLMIRAKRGKILNIGNFASERVIEAPVHYAASKAALRGFTEALAREVGRYGIHVNLLSPGLLDGGMTTMLPKHRVQEYLQQCPAGRLATMDEIAQIAVFLVSSQNNFMTAAKITADGGL